MGKRKRLAKCDCTKDCKFPPHRPDYSFDYGDCVLGQKQTVFLTTTFALEGVRVRKCQTVTKTCTHSNFLFWCPFSCFLPRIRMQSKQLLLFFLFERCTVLYFILLYGFFLISSKAHWITPSEHQIFLNEWTPKSF